jgi:microcystin-dependent protein
MLWIFDENLRRIGLLRQYEMAQWSNKFRDIGTFSINARYVDENLFLLDKTKTYYILLYMSSDETKSEQWNTSHNVFGKIEKVSKEDDEDADYPSIIKIEGRLMPFLFSKRVIVGTLDYKNMELITYIRDLITKCFEKNTERYIDMDVSYQKDNSIYDDIAITKQITGGQLWDEISDYLEQYKLGIIIAPKIHKTFELSDIYGDYLSGLSNVSGFGVEIKTGVDRTRGNGLNTVIFSKSLSNIKRTNYSYDSESDMNVAYVAGEGEGTERKWYEIQKDSENKRNAWNREELWIDARDLQSEGEDDITLTDEEYDKLIEQRTYEKFQENTVTDEYSATVNEHNQRYVYMQDYDLGDWVTVQDRDLGIEIDAQIVEVTTTLQNNETINDITFEYGKANKTQITDIKKLSASVEEISNNIKYFNKKMSDLLNAFYPVGSVYETMDSDFDPNKVWGGTWDRIKGRVLVGVDESDDDFKTADKTGGEKTHKLSTSEMPIHTHTLAGTAASAGNHKHTTELYHRNDVYKGSGNLDAYHWSFGTKYNVGTSESGSHTHRVSGTAEATGGGNAHNNLQPYVTCFIWKRTK